MNLTHVACGCRFLPGDTPAIAVWLPCPLHEQATQTRNCLAAITNHLVANADHLPAWLIPAAMHCLKRSHEEAVR